MGSDFIPRNGNSPKSKFALPGIATAPPAIKTPKSVHFLDRVRVKLMRSAVLELQNNQWAQFYAGATGRVIRFNIEDGTVVVILDTEDLLNENNRVMECFEEQDLERIDAQGNLIDLEGNIIDPEIKLVAPIAEAPKAE
jgi:hypothetical protein